MNPYLGEFIGTMVLLYFGNGVNAATTLKGSYAQNAGWLAICIGWGLGVTLGIYAVGGISGAHLNPAVTLGLYAAGEFPADMIGGYVLAQMGGAFCGACLAYFHFLPHWKATEDAAAKLGVFSTGPAIKSTSANVLSEFMGTFILIFAILFIGANEFTEGLNPLVVGGLIIAIGLSHGGTTGFAINPARDLGPRIAHAVLPIHGKGGSNWGYSWVPVLGPLAGGVTGAALYNFLFNDEVSLFLSAGVIFFAIIVILSLLENKKL
ncbi:MIP/aquaporin family protein [uncultured Imperialibacter sp.]|uniref:MIP/aquaporin family protein n=1 Tax=uncultured Imperialibacter sp. TaxID=1672639 RepID=UPI0030D7804B|tara:strand:- start:719 stop:1510 length:792 start_codon:yes stop_codon:yes gene_type:complete